MLLKADTDESPYDPVFRLWIQGLPNVFPSRLTEEKKPVRGSIRFKWQYEALWNVLHEKELLGSSHYPQYEYGMKMGRGAEINTDDAHQDSNLRNLAKLIDGISDENAIVAIRDRKKVDVREIANGIREDLGEVQTTRRGKAKDAKTLLRELKGRYRFLEAFIIAIKPPSDFNPETAVEGQMPYRISEDKNVASLASSLNRNDMDVFEKIFEARGGSQNEQSAYKVDFNKVDPKIQRLWENLRRVLRNPIEYYTIDFEEKNEPLFDALVYIFNQFGKGKGGERFFNKETQDAIRTALHEHKKTLRKPKTRIAELSGTVGAQEHAAKVRAKAKKAILAWREEKGLEAKLSPKEEAQISSVIELEEKLRKDGVETELKLGTQGFELWAKNADGKMVPHDEYLQNPQEGNDE